MTALLHRVVWLSIACFSLCFLGCGVKHFHYLLFGWASKHDTKRFRIMHGDGNKDTTTKGVLLRLLYDDAHEEA